MKLKNTWERLIYPVFSLPTKNEVEGWCRLSGLLALFILRGNFTTFSWFLVLGFLYLKRMMYACVLNHLIDYSLYTKMEYTDPITTGSAIDPSSSSRLAASLPTAVKGPCAACQILRRRCTDKCMLAPYFPPTETLKFIIAHKVFGASNIVKSLQVINPLQHIPYVDLVFHLYLVPT